MTEITIREYDELELQLPSSKATIEVTDYLMELTKQKLRANAPDQEDYVTACKIVVNLFTEIVRKETGWQ